MNITQSFMLAAKSLASSKMRSFLTMLGIIIGIAAVIALVSLMNGMSNEIVSSFEDMGMNNMTVTITPRGGNRTITSDDMQNFCDENSDVIAGMTPTVSVMSATVKKGSENITATSVTGVSEMYDDINGKKLEEGNFLTYLDVENDVRNCVIGTYVRNELFGSQSPIGQTLKINGNTFTVIGVLEESADSEESSSDDAILIPYTVASKIAFTRVTSYTISAVDNDHVESAKAALNRYLYGELGDTDLYNIITLQEAADTVNKLLGKMSAILVGIAGISLLVGGIGIMNIMLVSVTERTREIGLKKAIGAKKSRILWQFLTEAAVLTSLGGIVGVGAGIGLAEIISRVTSAPVAISVPSIIIAVVFSMVIGIIFGLLPSFKAANLNPIDALRHE